MFLKYPNYLIWCVSPGYPNAIPWPYESYKMIPWPFGKLAIKFPLFIGKICKNNLYNVNDDNILIILGYLQGYVNESFIVSTLFECQVKCDTLHSICRSLNYIENEDGSNICEINNEAQYCALPGDFIVKENSFYVEVMPEKDNVVSIIFTPTRLHPQFIVPTEALNPLFNLLACRWVCI